MEPAISPSEFGIELSIDGTRIDPASAWAHHQDDPYPGRHSYRLVLTGDAAKQLAGSLPATVSARLDKATTGHFFNLFALVFSIACRRAHSRFDFVLNTIETSHASGERIVVEGICSPFVRAEPSDLTAVR
jgi:hypothetical protein